MEIRFLGTGGATGWPQPGCPCASCRRAATRPARRPSRVLVDGTLLVGDGPPRTVSTGDGAADDRHTRTGHRVMRLAGGWDVTARDGTRLLVADRPGADPDVPDDVAPYDAVLLDLLGHPTRLGALRAQGLATGRTVAAALSADHRVPSERELDRRCAFWGALLPRDGDTVHAPQPTEPAPPSAPRRVLVLGGARSGKSAEAEVRLAAEPDVTYIATGPAADGTGTAEWAARIAAHRRRRPPWWRTVETVDLAGVLRDAHGAVLIDSVTTWLAATMDASGIWAGAAATATGRLAAAVDELLDAWRWTRARIVAVSDETGLGVVPETPAGRLFRDELGLLNQRLAAESDETVLVVAGRVLALPD